MRPSGSDQPEPEPDAEAALFVFDGELPWSIGRQDHPLSLGDLAYVPPETDWRVRQNPDQPVRFIWTRKAYEPVSGLHQREPIVTHEQVV